MTFCIGFGITCHDVKHDGAAAGPPADRSIAVRIKDYLQYSRINRRQGGGGKSIVN